MYTKFVVVAVVVCYSHFNTKVQEGNTNWKKKERKKDRIRAKASSALLSAMYCSATYTFERSELTVPCNYGNSNQFHFNKEKKPAATACGWTM